MISEAVITKNLAPVLAKIAAISVEKAKGPIAKIKDELLVRIRHGFKVYVENQIETYKNVKTIIGNNNPIPFENLYVNLFVESDVGFIRDENIIENKLKNNRHIFEATAGAGKSMLMRKLYFMYLTGDSGKLPIMLELRETNENSNKSIIDHLTSKISDFIEGFTSAQLRFALSKGLIVLFFDGYDEIDRSNQGKRANEIISLSNKYRDTFIFVSSRPDERFTSWQNFSVYKVADFKETQVRLLIDKIPYDQTSKDIFHSKLDGGLYKTHKEFLINPLLTLMMLITIGQFAEIPGKIHLFYEHAFEVLFSRHDLTKSGFQRSREIDLALDDYRRLLSYFCMVSYAHEAFIFSEAAALEFLETSINSSQIPASKSEMLSDLIGCTCMLVRYGLDLAFSHRSFQEYFVAYFLSRVRIDELQRVAPQLIARGTFDNVFPMIAEMNQEKFEELWALPEFEKIYRKAIAIEGDDKPFELISALLGDFTISINQNEMISATFDRDDSKINEVRLSLYRVYHLFDKIHKDLPNDRVLSEQFLSEVRNRNILAEDTRFDQIRFEPTLEKNVSIKVSGKDNWWLKRLWIGQFIVNERRELIAIHNSLSERVQKRRDGLKAIFKF